MVLPERGGDEKARPPVLVLGLGNLLLGDDAAGLRMLEDLASSRAAAWGEHVEFLDGGTQGIGLIGEIEGRKGVVILDAVGAGTKPGTVHFLRSPRAANGALYEETIGGGFEPFGAGRDNFRSTTAHEGNARELIATVALLGCSPEELVIVGVEPHRIATGIGLSPLVEGALGAALERAALAVEDMLRGFLLVARSLDSSFSLDASLDAAASGGATAQTGRQPQGA
jgi:hydrogenase maturation protease